MAENDSLQKNIDVDNLRMSGSHKAKDALNVEVKDDVIIIVTQAFGPKGDNLVGLSDVTFDGFAAVTVGVRVNGEEGLVHLSPFHGDSRKAGFLQIPSGSRCELFCPVSGEQLDYVGNLKNDGAGYYAIYLTEDLSQGDMVALSDIWGDYQSRIIDHEELISAWSREMDTLTR